MERFLESTIPVYVMAAVTILGILGTLATGIYYRQMIRQTENMMNARHSFLLQMKNRFENTYRVNKGIQNIPLFVDKQLGEHRFFLIRAESAGKASQKAALICLIFGSGVTMLQKIHHFGMGRILTSLAMTAFFSITGLCIYFLFDLVKMQERLKLYLEEYFTNNLSRRMARAKEEERILNRADARIETKSESGLDNRTESRHESRLDRRMEYRTDNRVEDRFDTRAESSLEGRAESQLENRTEGRKRKSAMTETSALGGQEQRKNVTSTENHRTDFEKNSFTEEDLRYLRQSLERIAAGRERNTEASEHEETQGKSSVSQNEKKHRFSAKEEKVIEDILREYFV